MNEVQHTPGPWSVESGGEYVMALNAGERIVCVMGGGDAEDKANAHLIAGAPDLLLRR